MASTGFNTSGGAYYIVTKDLEAVAGTAVFVHVLTNAGSNSGGAWVAPTLAPATMSAVVGSGISAANAANLVKAGALLKDMGKTVVSAGRVFRKFAPVVSGASAGVVGAPAAAPNTGYAAFYLEVGREGSGAPAPVAKYC